MAALKRLLSPGRGSVARGFCLIMPYAAWMAMMAILPQTAYFYALRGAVTALMLFAVPRAYDLVFRGIVDKFSLRVVGAGIFVGLAVLVVWIAPEMWFGVGQEVAASDSPYSPQVCGWALTIAKLAASALVIPIAEELFFRRWLVDFAGFWWMVALFAVEHGDRWHVGAVTGIVYGVIAKRFGLASSIVAHVVTNLGLGLIVILDDRWQFW